MYHISTHTISQEHTPQAPQHTPHTPHPQNDTHRKHPTPHTPPLQPTPTHQSTWYGLYRKPATVYTIAARSIERFTVI